MTLLDTSPHEIDASATKRPVLRLALLVDDLEQPAWIASCLAEVAQRGDARIELIIRNRSQSAAKSRSSRLASWWKNRRYLAHALYTRLDGMRPVTRDPFEPTPLDEWLGGIPVLDVVPRETRFADYFTPEDVERIRGFDLDVAVRFGFRILRGDVLQIARYGVWSYHHGDNRSYRGGPAGFWEVMKDDPVTGSMLQRLSEDLDGGQVLFRAWSHTIPFSVRRNRAHYYWQSAPMLAWKLRDLRCVGAAGLTEDASDDNPEAYSQRIFTTPMNREMIGHGIRLVARHASQRVRSAVKREQWFLAWRQDQPSPGEDGWPNLAPFRFRTIIPPTDRFWADPFPYRADGTTWVFFEECLERGGNPHIAVMEFGPNGPIASATTALSTDSRLSYPFVFGFEGKHYMMPETAARGCVQLWRAERLPSEWIPDRVLIDERPLVDATMAFVEGRWWIWAVATSSGGVSWDELYLYHSDSPLGPWQPHSRNPVIVDVRGARPAGRLFQHNGVWYRPAQDCSKSYGGGLVIHRIERLDLLGYRERAVTRIDPAWAPGLVGAHTINAAGGLTIMDVRRRHWRWEK